MQEQVVFMTNLITVKNSVINININIILSGK